MRLGGLFSLEPGRVVILWCDEPFLVKGRVWSLWCLPINFLLTQAPGLHTSQVGTS